MAAWRWRACAGLWSKEGVVERARGVRRCHAASDIGQQQRPQAESQHIHGCRRGCATYGSRARTCIETRRCSAQGGWAVSGNQGGRALLWLSGSRPGSTAHCSTLLSSAADTEPAAWMTPNRVSMATTTWLADSPCIRPAVAEQTEFSKRARRSLQEEESTLLMLRRGGTSLRAECNPCRSGTTTAARPALQQNWNHPDWPCQLYALAAWAVQRPACLP